MLFEVLTVLSFVVFVVGTITDIKKREFPDYLSGLYVISAVAIRAVWALVTKDAMIVLPSIFFGLVVFLFSYLMYKLRMWGGGDVKLLTGTVIALTGFNDKYLFILFYMINFFVVGALYGIAMSLLYALKNPEAVKKDIINKTNFLKILISLISSAIILFTIKTQIAKIVAVMLPLTILLDIVLRAVEKNCFVKKIAVSKLTEGDWVITRLKGIYEPERDICVNEKIIKEFKKRGFKTVIVKEGIPYIPSFLIAFILTLINKEIVFVYLMKIMGFSCPPIL